MFNGSHGGGIRTFVYTLSVHTVSARQVGTRYELVADDGHSGIWAEKVPASPLHGVVKRRHVYTIVSARQQSIDY